MSLTKKILTGAGWNVFAQAGGQVIALVSMVFLVRWLGPEDFGLIAMCATLKSLAFIFANLGLSAAVVQKKEIDELYLSTAFWVSLAAGVVVTTAVAVTGPFMVWFFHRPELTGIVAVSSVTFAISGLSSTHRASLERRMAFRTLSIIELFVQLGASGVGVLLAAKGFGYWSLVVREITADLLGVPLLWYAARWVPQVAFCRRRFNDLFGFSVYVLGSNMVNFFNRSGDKVIIGKFLGAASLGIYNFAYNLMLKPLQYISHTVGRALFPALSQIQKDKAQVRKIYLQSVKIISLITFPMMGGLWFIASDVIPLAFGEKWLPAVPVFEILCLIGALQSVGTTVGSILLSQGRSGLAFKMTLFISPFVWIAFFAGLPWGIVGVAKAYAIVSLCWFYVSHYLANRIIDLSMKAFLLELAGPACATIIMVVALHFSNLEAALPKVFVDGYLLLAAQIVFGCVVYATIIALLYRRQIPRAFYALSKKAVPVPK